MEKIAGVLALMDCLLGNYMSNRISAFQKLFVHLFADLVLSSRAHLILIFDLIWPAYWKNSPHDAGAEKIIVLFFPSKFFYNSLKKLQDAFARNFWETFNQIPWLFKFGIIAIFFTIQQLNGRLLSNCCWSIRKGSLLVV